MSEKCTIRDAEQSRGVTGYYVGEQDIPAVCMQCISKAITDAKTQITLIDTSHEALKTFEGAYEHNNTDGADKWAYTWMEMPTEGDQRLAHEEVGFDIFTHSYDPDSTIRVQDISFECPSN